MKQKFIILSNSITYDKELEIYEADFSKSKLSDKDISEELSDTCATLEQAQLNTIILTAKDVAKFIKENNTVKNLKLRNKSLSNQLKKANHKPDCAFCDNTMYSDDSSPSGWTCGNCDGTRPWHHDQDG